MPTPAHEPEKVFEYVERVKALPPPTTIENAIHDEHSYSFTAPTAAHRAGDRGDVGVDDSTPKFFGHPSSAAALPPLEAFDQPSTLRSTFERHHPRPASSAAQGSPSSSLRRKNASSRERRVSTQPSCDKISVQDMNGFIKGVGADAEDCVTANDYAVRIAEALRTQYDISAPMSTAPVATGCRGELASDASLRRLHEPLGARPVRLGARNSVVDIKSRSDKDTIAMLEREIRSQGFEIERLERRLRMRVTTTDVRLVENRAADLRESVQNMKQEVGFIAEDTFEAFAEFKREFEALPCVREIQASAPAARARAVAESLAGGKADQPTLATQATFAVPADKGMSAGAVLRASARIVEATAEVAGQRSGCPIPAVTSDKADLTRAMGGHICRGLGSSSATLPSDTLDGVTAYTGTEAPNVNRALRGALWMLAASAKIDELKADLVKRDAAVERLETQLQAAEAAAVAAAGAIKSPTAAATSPKSSAAGKGRAAAQPQAAASKPPPPAKQLRSANPKAAPTPKAAKVEHAAKAPSKVVVPAEKKEAQAPALAAASTPRADRQRAIQVATAADEVATGAVRSPTSMPAEHTELNASAAPCREESTDLSPRVADGPTIDTASALGRSPAARSSAAEASSPALGPAAGEVRTPTAGVPTASSSVMEAGSCEPTRSAVEQRLRAPGPASVPAAPLQDQLASLIAEEPGLADQPVRKVMAWLQNPSRRRIGGAQPGPAHVSAAPDASDCAPVTTPGAAAPAPSASEGDPTTRVSAGPVDQVVLTPGAGMQPVPQPASWKSPAAAAAATKPAAAGHTASVEVASIAPSWESHAAPASDGFPSNSSATFAATAAPRATVGNPTATVAVDAPTPNRRPQAPDSTPERQPTATDPGGDSIVRGDGGDVSTPLPAVVDEDSLMASPIVAKPLGAATQSVLKFRVTPSKAATPPPNKTRMVDTTAAEAAKLERMRRALENGVQLHKFREHSQLLFDSRCEVQFPERAETGLSGLTPDPK